MDLAAVAFTVLAAAAAAVVAIVVGSRRGLDQAEERADRETAQTVAAMERRLAVLTADLADARSEVDRLRSEVARLRTELAEEKAGNRVMAEAFRAQQGDGR